MAAADQGTEQRGGRVKDAPRSVMAGGGVDGPEGAAGVLARLGPKGLAAGAAAAVVALGIGAVSVAYALDARAHDGEVVRGVEVDGTGVGGKDPAALDRALADVARRFGATRVEVVVPEGDTIKTDAATIGLGVDVPRTAKAALATGRTGSLPSRVVAWAQARLGRSRSAPVTTAVDRAKVLDLVAANAREGERSPIEATITVGRASKVFVGVAGRAGRGIDANRLALDLPEAVRKGTDPVRVQAVSGEVQPRFSKDDADALAKRAESLVKDPLPLQAGDATGSLSPTVLRSLLSAVAGADHLELRFDEAAATTAAGKALVKAGTAAEEPTFNVNAAGGVDVTPGKPGLTCCGADAGAKLADAVLNRDKQPGTPVQLSLVESQPKLSLDQAQALGVKEVVSTFTTKHPSGQPRVKNIHRIADLIRGHVILPGETFSVNAFVGPRTLEKGFVVDHVIEDGKFAEAVGGGISQFATTSFNAAWFAGMEFGEYQSHSLYISRYPYGREATLNYPHPDLQIKNPSPYGVLIWPTYTGSSLTVTLYSTKWVDVKAMGQDKTPSGSCTKVISKRQRTFLDGRVVNDTTRALYRANEGQNCGDDEPPDEESSTTTAKPGATTTTVTTKPGATTTTKPAATTTTTKKPATTTTKAG